MKKVSALTALALVAGCKNGSAESLVCNPEEPCNFDMEIDGGGQDYNNLNPDWQPDINESFDSQMCVAADGTIYAVWYEVPYQLEGDKPVQTGFVDVWFNRSDDGGLTWLSSPTRVKQGPGDASAVSMDCAGDRVYVVWEDDRVGETGYQSIFINFSTDRGATWETQDIQLDNDPDGFAISLGPKVILYEGQIHVVWYDQVYGAPDIFITTSVNGGKKWGEPVRISGGRDGADGELSEEAGASWNGNPQIAIDPTGLIYVAWESTKNGKQDIFCATSANQGQGFNPQRRIDTGDERGANYSFAPKLAVSDGHAYVVWHDSRSGEHRDIYMNYSSDGGDVWLDAALRVESLTGEGFSESLNPDLFVEGSKAHFVWQDANEGAGYDIFYRTADNGIFGTSDAGKEIRLDTDESGAGNSALPRIAKQGDNIAITWADYRNDAGAGYNDLYYNTFPGSGDEPAWLEEDLPLKSLSPGSSFTEDHQIAIDDGILYTMWIDGRNGARDVFFSRVALGEAIESLEILTEGAKQPAAE